MMQKSLAGLLFIIGSLVTVVSLAAPASPQDVRAIVYRVVPAIFGQDRENTFTNDALLSEAVLNFMGAADDVQGSGDGNVMLTGCRPHSCMEKSAAIVDPRSRRLLAVGLLHFNCRRTVFEGAALVEARTTGGIRPRNDCDKQATLAIFVIRQGETPDELGREHTLVSAIRTWGKTDGYATEVLKLKQLQRRK